MSGVDHEDIERLAQLAALDLDPKALSTLTDQIAREGQPYIPALPASGRDGSEGQSLLRLDCRSCRRSGGAAGGVRQHSPPGPARVAAHRRSPSMTTGRSAARSALRLG